MFENWVLRKIFAPTRDMLTGEWRKLHEELNDLTKYYLGDQIENNEIAEHVARMGTRRGAYEVLVGKPEGKRSLGRPRHRWEDNIKMDLQDVGWGA
jgi:hypothetical protein